MKTKVLSNILDYIIENDITNRIRFHDIIENESEIDVISRPKIGLGYIELPKNAIWTDISSNLNFDNISFHLLDNFSSTIDVEDYKSAGAMKKEILDRWDISDDNFWEIGKNYLSELKAGTEMSKLFKNSIGDEIREVEKIWISEKIDSLSIVIERLIDILNYMVSYSPDELTEDVIDLIENDGVIHPMTSIEEAIDYFKLLKEQ